MEIGSYWKDEDSTAEKRRTRENFEIDVKERVRIDPRLKPTVNTRPIRTRFSRKMLVEMELPCRGPKRTFSRPLIDHGVATCAPAK